MRSPDLIKKFGIIKFNENFANSYTPPSNGTFLNFQRGWNLYSYENYGIASYRPQFTSSAFYAYCHQGSGAVCGTLYRSNEGYSFNRNFDISYAFYNAGTGNSWGGSMRTELSLFGNIGFTDLPANDGYIYPVLGGLSFSACSSNGRGTVLYVQNNYITIGQITVSSDTWNYVFAKKRGNILYVATNTTNIIPGSFNSYNITDKTTLSNSLILNITGSAFSSGAPSANMSLLNVTLY